MRALVNVRAALTGGRGGRSREENRARGLAEDARGNAGAAHAFYTKAVDVSPQMVHDLIRVRTLADVGACVRACTAHAGAVARAAAAHEGEHPIHRGAV